MIGLEMPAEPGAQFSVPTHSLVQLRIYPYILDLHLLHSEYSDSLDTLR